MVYFWKKLKHRQKWFDTSMLTHEIVCSLKKIHVPLNLRRSKHYDSLHVLHIWRHKYNLFCLLILILIKRFESISSYNKSYLWKSIHVFTWLIIKDRVSDISKQRTYLLYLHNNNAGVILRCLPQRLLKNDWLAWELWCLTSLSEHK